MLHKGYTKVIMPAGIMSSASINIIRSNPIISADLSGLSVIRSFIIRMNPVYDKTDGGLNGFHRSTSLVDTPIFDPYFDPTSILCYDLLQHFLKKYILKYDIFHNHISNMSLQFI